MGPKIITRAERLAQKAAKSKITGMGDLVAIVAQPTAKIIDFAIGTDIANCTPCKKRREKWNKVIPFTLGPRKEQRPR